MTNDKSPTPATGEKWTGTEPAKFCSRCGGALLMEGAHFCSDTLPEFRKCQCVCHKVGLFGLMCCECTTTALNEFVNGKPQIAAPSDSEGTKDKAQKFAEGAYALLSLGDHAKLPNTFVAVLAELYRNSVAAPLLNSVDTPAPVPEPEPAKYPFKRPPARKHELGTCQELIIQILKNCAADFCQPQKRNPENPQWRVDCAIANGVTILENSPLFAPVAPQASPEHDLRKQDTPESKEHWDFVAEATARVEAMPEWKKNSVAVGGSPEAPANFPWTIETMKLINNMTPDIKGKAFDPDWFLLRNRLEEFEARLGLSGRAE